MSVSLALQPGMGKPGAGADILDRGHWETLNAAAAAGATLTWSKSMAENSTAAHDADSVFSYIPFP